MSEGKANPVRFGAEFGPESVTGSTTGVSLSTFKRLVWISNIGGLCLLAVALEMIIAYNMFWWGLAAAIAGVIVALFPSNYEIVGMDEVPDMAEESKDSTTED